jgi:hypothetical protein
MAKPPAFAGGTIVQGAAPPSVSPADGMSMEADAGSAGQVWQMSPPERSEAFKKVMRSQIRAANKSLYADLGAELGLDKETANKLIDLFTAQQVDHFDRVVSETDPAESERKMAEIERQNKAAIEDLIGPEKARSLEEYQRSTPARNAFEMLARQLDANDVPLTAEQGRKLRAAYVEEWARVPQPVYIETDGTGEKYFKSLNDWQEDYNRRISDAAAGILDSQQLAHYNDLQQWQNEARTGTAVAAGAMGGSFFVRGGAVPIAAAAESVTFVAPAPPPTADEARKP